jgi:arabinose-5-phosphate isomerase
MHQIFTNALEALEIEINALKSMRTRMGTGEDIVQAVQTILSTRGRAVVLGMGKSGIVGQKIAATLASTGTPAFFVHPGEAFHGDLGMIKPSDIAILISNSGETEEIIRILPFLGEQKNKVIGLTGNTNSTLAKFADVVLDVGAEREACNNNLAPTSSTTCTLVMGDVLAVALSKERGFMPEDFARFHPGGSLGRKLLTRVSDVMHRNLPMVTSGATLNETVLAMTEGRLGVALVMESSGTLKGLFTDGDLRRALMKERVGMSDCVDVHMTQQPLIIEEDVRLVEAETLMRKHKVRCLVVMDGKSLTPVGLVELFDF